MELPVTFVVPVNVLVPVAVKPAIFVVPVRVPPDIFVVPVRVLGPEEVIPPLKVPNKFQVFAPVQRFVAGRIEAVDCRATHVQGGNPEHICNVLSLRLK